MSNSSHKSIRKQLLTWLILPLCTLWLINAALSYYLAVKFANDKYDSELVNSADSVVARLKLDGSKITIYMPLVSLNILRHNEQDQFYYQVSTMDGKKIAGNAALPLPFRSMLLHTWIFDDAVVGKENIRLVSAHMPFVGVPQNILLIQAAETLHARDKFANKILVIGVKLNCA